MKRLAATALLLLFFTPAAPAGGPGHPETGWNPPGWEVAFAREPDEPASPGAVVLLGALDVYRALLSPIDGKRCPSYPSCSAYAVDAVQREGAWWGGVLTAGRLLGEADEAAFAPKVYRNDEWLVYYPVDSDLAIFGRGDNAP